MWALERLKAQGLRYVDLDPPSPRPPLPRLAPRDAVLFNVMPPVIVEKQRRQQQQQLPDRGQEAVDSDVRSRPAFFLRIPTRFRSTDNRVLQSSSGTGAVVVKEAVGGWDGDYGHAPLVGVGILPIPPRFLQRGTHFISVQPRRSGEEETTGESASSGAHNNSVVSWLQVTGNFSKVLFVSCIYA